MYIHMYIHISFVKNGLGHNLSDCFNDYSGHPDVDTSLGMYIPDWLFNEGWYSESCMY
jgi:hypothetical protein